MKRLLLIEDEPNFARFLELELAHEGFDVTVSHNGREGFQLAADRTWDIILLGMMLPGLSGIEICRRLRNAKATTPIIMLTARNSVMDRVSGLDSGADDFIPKPFEIEELLARIRALFRRVEIESHDQPASSLDFQDIHIDLPSRTVTRGGDEIELTKREYDLLLVLLQHKNTVLSRERLLDLVWGYNTGAETNVVDVYIRYLRQKISNEDKEKYIQTIRGVGYVVKE